jgi:hypothetical protein
MADLKALEEERKAVQMLGVQSAMEIAKTLQQGKAPSNVEVTNVLESVEAAIDSQKLRPSLDEKGKTILRDTENLLGATKELIKEKNFGEKVQRIIEEASLASGPVADLASDAKDSIKYDRESMKLRELKFKMLETANIARDVLQLIVTSSEFRSMLLSLISIAKSIFLDVTDAARAQPDPESAYKAAAEVAKEKLKQGLPAEERDKLYSELKALINDVNEHSEWEQGVRNIISLVERIEITTERAADKASEAAVQIQMDQHAQNVVQQTKELAEEFLPGDKTLDPFIDHVKTLVRKVKNDEKISKYFSKVKSYLEEALDDPSRVQTDTYQKEGSKLIEEGRMMLQDQGYQKIVRDVLDEWHDVFMGFKSDDELNMFKSALDKLVSDFTKIDSKGNTKLDTDAISQLKTLLVPLLVEELKFIPIPRLEGSNEDYDWTAEDIILSGYDIFPEHVKVSTATESDLSLRDVNPGWTRGYMLIAVDGIKTKMMGMKFSYKRKSFPRVEDAGIADVDISGGINVQIRINLESELATGRLLLTTGTVYVRVDGVKVKVSESKHDWIYNMFPGLFATPIKDGMQRTIADSLANLTQRFKDSVNQAMIKAANVSLSDTLSKAVQQGASMVGISQSTA